MTSPKGPAKRVPPVPRVPLPRSERGPLAGARRVGPADPQQRAEVTVVVRRRAELVRPFTRERPPLSREVFAAAHGADPADLQRMRRFAAEFGLQIVSEHVGRRAVVLSGTVAAFSRGFEVELGRYAHPAGTFRCRTGLLTIPSELEPVIEGVFGLDDRPQARTHFRIRRAVGAALAFAPPLVAQAYDFPASVDGSGQTIAILELGGGYRQADLDSFFKGLQLATPVVTALSVDDATNAPSGDPNSADGEVELISK